MKIGSKRRSGRHIGPGDLIRLLDGETSGKRRRQLEDHLGACRSCQVELERLRRAAVAFGGLLTASDAPVPAVARSPRPRDRRVVVRRPPTAVGGLTATAAIVIVAMVIGVGPVRAWVADRLGDIRALVGKETPAASDAPESDLRPATASITFTPTAAEFVLRIRTRQDAGHLSIAFQEDDGATAEVADGTDEDFVVLPNGLEILNRTTSSASYRLAIPNRYASIVLAVGSEPPVLLSPGAAEAAMRIDLTRPMR